MKANKVLGTLEVRVGSKFMEASILFTPASNGPEWDLQGLTVFMEKQRIREGFTAASLEKVFSALVQAKPEGGPVTLPVAQGTSPEASTPESCRWEDHPVPSEYKEDAVSFFRHHGTPEFFETRIEKVQTTRTVKEKQGLFRSAREKEEIVTRDKEVRVPISVNPQVIAQGWIKEGENLGKIIPGIQGADGRDVHGRPVLAEKPVSNLVMGQGVERRGEELIALVTGFLRRGENWVEVLPFHSHEWEVLLSSDQNTVHFNFTPGREGSTPPQPEMVLEEARALGVPGETLLSPYELGTVIQKAIDAKNQLRLFPVSTAVDGFFEITVSEDKLKAFLSMGKSRGRGKPLVLKDFGRELKEKKFKEADYKKIQEDVLAFYRGKETELKNYVLAEGTPPASPGERSIDYTVKYLSDNEVSRIKELARNLALDSETAARAFSGLESLEEYSPDSPDRMGLITKGVLVAEISQEPGEPGRDVFGGKVESEGGGDSGIRILEGVEKQGIKIFTSADGLLEQWDREKGPVFRVRPHRDAVVEIKLSANRMSASMNLSRAQGTGNPLDQAAVERLMGEKGIVYGIDRDVVSRAILRANEGEDVQQLVFANGEPPLNGEEAHLEFLVQMSTGKGVTLRADGRADYRNQDHITIVEKGQTIARITRSQVAFKDGTDVTGQSISARSAEQEAVEAGDNVEQKEEGTNLVFIASSGGEVVYQNRRLSVLNTHLVQGNVGKTTGNIKFSGTVKVSGLIQSGFFVMAGEDILVKDNVEAALVSAGKSIYIEKGVVGGGKAILRARETIQTTFVEQCTILSINDISIKRSCMLCSVKTNGKVVLAGDKGVILGGVVRARSGVNTFFLGSAKQVKTMVHFGQDYLIQDQIELEEAEVEKVKVQITKLDLQLAKAEKDGHVENIHRLRSEKLKMMKTVEKRSMRLLILRERFEEHCPSEVVVRGTVYPGVVLESHGRTLDIREESSKVTFFFDLETGKIQKKQNKEKE